MTLNRHFEYTKQFRVVKMDKFLVKIMLNIWLALIVGLPIFFVYVYLVSIIFKIQYIACLALID